MNSAAAGRRNGEPLQGLLVVISGPSGAGKGTLCQKLLERFPRMGFAVSATTRKPRAGEVDSRHYYFLDEEEFKRKIEAGEFLEWARVYGNYYGTPRREVEERLQAGQDVLLDIDAQGALQVRGRYPDGVFLFVMAPSLEDLERRLRQRGTDSDETIQYRLREAVQQIEYIGNYDYLVINSDLQEAVETIASIVVAEKCRIRRQDLSWLWRLTKNRPSRKKSKSM